MERARGLERLNAKMKVTLTEEVVDMRQVVQVKVSRAGYQEERGKLEEKVANVMKAIFKGGEWDGGVWEEAVRELSKDILKV